MEFFSKNDEIIELAPMIPPMKRTKRWIEENHEDLQASSMRSNDTVVCYYDTVVRNDTVVCYMQSIITYSVFFFIV